MFDSPLLFVLCRIITHLPVLILILGLRTVSGLAAYLYTILSLSGIKWGAVAKILGDVTANNLIITTFAPRIDGVQAIVRGRGTAIHAH